MHRSATGTIPVGVGRRVARGAVLSTVRILRLSLRTLLVLSRLSLMLALMGPLSLMLPLPLPLMRLVWRTRRLLRGVVRVLRSVMQMLRGTLRRQPAANSQREHTPSELEF